MPARRSQEETRPVRSAKRGRRAVWLLLGAGALVALPVLLAAGAYLVFRFSDTISPGVHVGEVPVGGLSRQQAQQLLDQAWNQQLQITAVDASDAGRLWLASPAEFGLSVDAAASAEQAYAFGRAEGLGGIPELWQAFTEGFELPPIVKFDAAAARSGLERWAASASIAPRDARLGLTAGQVDAVSAEWGVRLDIDTSLELLAANPEAVLLEYRFVPLVTTPVAPAIGEVAGAAAEAEQLLSQPVELRAYDPVTDEWMAWSPSREQRAEWLLIQADNGGYHVRPDRSRVADYVDKLQSELGEERGLDADLALELLLGQLRGAEAEPMMVRYAPRHYVVEYRDTLVSISFKVGIPYWKWMELNPQVSARGLVPGESLTIPPLDAMLELPVVVGKRVVVSIPEQRMWVYQDGELLWEHVISTGIANSPTMPGLFQVKSHYENAYASNWDLYMPHFLGIYHAVPNFLNGIHGLPLLSNGVRLWANVLGSPASYGCIVLDLEAAEQLYEWAEDGVVVEIKS